MTGIILVVLTDLMVVSAGIVTGLADTFIMHMTTLEEPDLSSVQVEVAIACSD